MRVHTGLLHESRYSELVVLCCPLQTGPLLLLVLLAHDAVQFFTRLLLSLQLGLLLFLLLLQEVLVFGVLSHVGFLLLEVVHGAQSLDQGCHLKEWEEKCNALQIKPLKVKFLNSWSFFLNTHCVSVVRSVCIESGFCSPSSRGAL